LCKQQTPQRSTGLQTCPQGHKGQRIKAKVQLQNGLARRGGATSAGAMHPLVNIL